MSTFRSPVGPQPPSVYWRRRLLVGLGLVAIIVVIVLIVVRPGSGQTGAPAPDTSGSPSAEAEADEPEPDPTFTNADGSTSSGGDAAFGTSGTACNPNQVQVTAVTDSASYGASAQPMISMAIVNTGSAPCDYDAGTAAQEYIITSGDDRIWSSKDCQTGAANNVIALQPGEQLTTQPFAWDRTRSSTDTCESQRQAVTGGGASYHLSVKLGESESAETTQFLLN